LETHSALIHQRLTDGFIRDVHGDLHTRNIFAYPDPVVFDCIEFNDHFRQIDVLNEVAFLCMDLEANGFSGLSAAFLETYASETSAMQGRGERLLFVWFKCYRANIRAKVTALGAAQAGDHPAAKQEMERYLRLMEQYAAILTESEGE
jgi:aminoglycoside phosphotransferase family enzyme